MIREDSRIVDQGMWVGDEGPWGREQGQAPVLASLWGGQVVSQEEEEDMSGESARVGCCVRALGRSVLEKMMKWREWQQ